MAQAEVLSSKPPRAVVLALALLPSLIAGLARTKGADGDLVGALQAGVLRAGPLLLACVVASILAVRLVRGRLAGDAAVAGLLLALTLPVDTSPWPAAVAAVFGVLVGREIFGPEPDRGFVHPAVLGHVFLLLTWPHAVEAPTWAAGSTGGAIASGALLPVGLGAVVMLLFRQLPWRILGGVAIGLALAGASGLGSSTLAPPSVFDHLSLGTLAFGVVFLATDPAASPRIRSAGWFHGVLVGFLVVVFRLAKSGSPDGTMSALLLASLFAPLADHVVMLGRSRREAARG